MEIISVLFPHILLERQTNNTNNNELEVKGNVSLLKPYFIFFNPRSDSTLYQENSTTQAKSYFSVNTYTCVLPCVALGHISDKTVGTKFTN